MTIDRLDRLYLSDKIDSVLTHRLLGPRHHAARAVRYLPVHLRRQRAAGWAGSKRFFGWLGDTAANIIPEGLVQSLVVSGVIDGVEALWGSCR